MLFNAAASSGAYYFNSCKPTEELILQRKETWWGDNYYSTPGELFVANPKKIIYKLATMKKYLFYNPIPRKRLRFLKI